MQHNIDTTDYGANEMPLWTIMNIIPDAADDIGMRYKIIYKGKRGVVQSTHLSVPHGEKVPKMGDLLPEDLRDAELD